MTCKEHNCRECRRVYAAGFITWLVLLVFLGAILVIVSGCGARVEREGEPVLEQQADYSGPEWDALLAVGETPGPEWAIGYAGDSEKTLGSGYIQDDHHFFWGVDDRTVKADLLSILADDPTLWNTDWEPSQGVYGAYTRLKARLDTAYAGVTRSCGPPSTEPKVWSKAVSCANGCFVGWPGVFYEPAPPRFIDFRFAVSNGGSSGPPVSLFLQLNVVSPTVTVAKGTLIVLNADFHISELTRVCTPSTVCPNMASVTAMIWEWMACRGAGLALGRGIHDLAGIYSCMSTSKPTSKTSYSNNRVYNNAEWSEITAMINARSDCAGEE